MHEAFTAASSMPYLMLDVGCNKGYASADFLNRMISGTDINPSSLVDVILAVSQKTNAKINRDGGVCNNSKHALNVDRRTKQCWNSKGWVRT